MNEPKLSEARLLEILGKARRDVEAETDASLPKPGPHPITFARARELALDPGRWTEAERAHAATCRSCAHMVATFQREIPHPSLWELLFWKLGHASDAQRQRMRYHVEEGMCRICQERLRQVETLQNAFAALPTRIPLPDPSPEVLNAAMAFSPVKAQASDARLEADLYKKEDAFLLEVRTKDAALKYHPVSFAILGDEGRDPLTGFVVLHPDRRDWLAATATFTPGELYNALGSVRLLVMPMEIADLTAGDEDALLASAVRSRDREAEREAWLVWAGQQAGNARMQAILEALKREE